MCYKGVNVEETRKSVKRWKAGLAQSFIVRAICASSMVHLARRGTYLAE